MADQRERKRKRAGSAKRDQKHQEGGNWTSITLPEGLKLWQPKAGQSYRVDIIPFEAGEGNPHADPGEWYYERTYYRHAGIGPDNGLYCCLSRTFRKPCPICEYRANLSNDPDANEEAEKMIKDLAPKERQLFLILDHKNTEDGVQLWEFSYHNFGKLLDFDRRDAEEDEDYIKNFDDERGGAALRISFSEEKFGGRPFAKAQSIKFTPRPNGLDSELLGHGICLDKLLKEMPYDELKAIFLQTGGSSDDKPQQGETQQPESRQWKTAEECGIRRMDEVVYNGEICMVSRVSPDGTSLTLIDPDDEVIKAVASADVTKAEDVKEPIPQAPTEQVADAVDSSSKDAEPDWDEDWDND